MNTAEAERLIQAPVEAVADVLDDMAGWPEWMGISEVTVEGGQRKGPLGVGTRYQARAGVIKDLYEVVESDPPRLRRYRLVSGTLPVTGYQGEVILEPSGEGTLIRWRTVFSPRLLGTGWLFERLIEAQHRKAVQALAERVQGHPAKDEA